MRRLTNDMQFMMVCRIANLAVGLLMIPLLLHFLKGEQFAGWALYLAFGMAFSTFETASFNTLVHFLAQFAQDGSREGISRVLTNGLISMSLLYCMLSPLVIVGAWQLSRWLYLPGSAFISPPLVIICVFFAAFLRALLLIGQQLQLAGGNFKWYSLASFVQPLMGNVAAVIAAYFFRRADAAVISSWSAQLAMLVVYTSVSQRQYGWSFRISYINLRTIRILIKHGIPLQINEWAHFLNYQLDKFLIAGITGLWAVGPYEVASRAALALRSVPASSFTLLLPEESVDKLQREDIASRYRKMSRYAAFSGLFFIWAPLAAGWYFLYAWAGQTGYYARWLFPTLSFGAISTVVALPAFIILQTEGHSEVISRAALCSVPVNLALSLLLIPFFGGAGAALSNGVSTALGSALVIYGFHNVHNMLLRETFRDLWASIQVPLILITAIGIISAFSFKIWFTPAIEYAGFTFNARFIPALIAVLLFGVSALIIAIVVKKRLALDKLGNKGEAI